MNDQQHYFDHDHADQSSSIPDLTTPEEIEKQRQWAEYKASVQANAREKWSKCPVFTCLDPMTKVKDAGIDNLLII